MRTHIAYRKKKNWILNQIEPEIFKMERSRIRKLLEITMYVDQVSRSSASWTALVRTIDFYDYY